MLSLRHAGELGCRSQSTEHWMGNLFHRSVPVLTLKARHSSDDERAIVGASSRLTSYSARKACAGSMETALRAGSAAAIKLLRNKIKTAAPNRMGLAAFT